MRRAVWQWLLMGFALVWGASGCSCGEPPVESELVVAFERPTDGQRLALTDDEDGATDGFQYEVVALARDTSGRQMRLASAKLEVRTPSEQAWRAGPEAVIDGGTVRFPGTLLQPRTNVLQVTVEEAGSRRTATQRISVTVSTEPPSVTLTQPAEGQVLREADDADPEAAGYQLRFAVKGVGLAGKTGTLYCEQACGVPPTDFTLPSSGEAQVSVTLSQSACLAQQAECYAVVRTGNSALPDVQSSRRRITLDTVAPRVEVVSPVAPVSSHTFKVEAVVGCCEDGSSATLTREGEPPRSAAVSGGVVSFPAVSAVDGLHAYTLRITDSGGNVTERPLSVHVASVPATLTLNVPTTVFMDADGVAHVDATATTSATEPQTQLEFYTSVTGMVGHPVRVATTPVTGGGRAATLRISLAEGSNSVRACVRNPALPPTCQAVTVSVDKGRPSCRIVSPLDADERGASGSPVPVSVETSASAVTVRLLRMDGSQVSSHGPVSVSGGTAQVPVALPTDADRSYRLVATCGTGGVSQAVTVTRDTAPPSLTVEVSGDAGDGVLGPETQDTSTQAGTQVKVTAVTEPFASVALTGCGAGNSFTTTADATGRAVLREVTVPSTGHCTLSVSATDLAGNRAGVDKPLALALTRGALALEAPAGDRVLGPSDGAPRTGGGLTVDVRVGITAGAGTLRLFLGTTEVGAVTVAAGETEKVFTGVALQEGANVVRATLSGAAGATACATALLTVDTTPGAITLENPRAAASLGLANDLNRDVPGIQANLRYTVSAASAGARVDICSSEPLRPGAAPCRDGSDFFTLASSVEPFVSEFTYPDGQYSIKAVLDDGSLSSSQEVPLVVDSERPRVTRVTIEGDANGDGQLNLAEQPSGNPAVLVTVTGLEEGRSVQVRSATDGALFGQATASEGAARVVLSGLPNLTEASYSLVVVATDGVGNSNKISNPLPLDPLNTEAFLTLRVDRAAPTLTVSSPGKASFGGPDDAAPEQAGFQLRLTLTNLSADVGTEGVEVTLTPPGTVLRRTPSGQAVSELLTLPDSGTTAYELSIRVVDRAGNVTTQTRAFTVDLEPPVLTVTSPVAGATYDTINVPLSADVTGAEGATVSVFRAAVGGGTRTPVTSLTVTGGAASGSASLTNGAYDIIFEVADAAGNLASRTVSNVRVDFTGCDPRLTRPAGSPVTLNQRDDLDPGAAELQYRVEGDAPACPGSQVRLYRDGAATPEATTVADAASGAFAFDVTLPDGQSTTLRVEVDDGAGSSTSVSAVLNVDITPPEISNVVPAETTLFFVADSNEAFFLLTPTPGYIRDRIPDGDAEAELTARVTGAMGGSVRVTYRGVDVATPETPGTNDELVSMPITLPHDTTGELVLVVRDAAGNEARHTASATVDVIPPANPLPQVALAPGAERTATVDVTWSAVGDDGMSGVPSGYDLRWSHEATLPGGIPDDATFFGGRVRRGSPALLPAASTSFALTPLPPFETYSIQLRARDEVGNYSRFVPSRILVNVRTRDVLDPGGNGTRFGFMVASNGDLDGVAGDELVVADFDENSNQGAVYVFSGGAGTAQALVPPADGVQTFGWDMGIGNVGDAAGEGKPDLVVGAPAWASNRGRVFLYFGRTGAGVQGVDPVPIELRGTAAGTRFGIAARVINDITGDGLGEVAISASSENANNGKVYLYFGRTRAAWEALRVDESTGAACTAATTACIIPTSKADRVIDGEDATSSFGRWRGMVGLGDINGDGVNDFGIPASRETVNRYYLFSGEAVRTSPAPTAIRADSALQRLTQPVGTEASSFNGFGMAALGGVNLIGGAGVDLVVSRARTNTLFLYADGGPTGFGTPQTILGSGNFGNSLAAGDINGDGRVDLVIGTDQTNQGSAWIFYNTATGFDTLTGQFNQARLVGPEAKALGVSVAVGDFNADGKPDIAAGDNLDALGRRVRIWY
jgi:large repetitive protein